MGSSRVEQGFTDAVAVKQVNNLSFSVFVGKRGDLGQQIPSFRRATATRSTEDATAERWMAKGK